ncbi:MAG: hypothetical protein KJ620_08630 [Candidatus Edwardsbacteria bacterium]|nr:hypothetical protein [Candidatus Edwardsbacteria bacterium]MBU1576785.1 hypothetical protein [Candidatus Edwardsbacteria bacterium]MBU2464576.1 hypothetical protein [Candidatus Edwardsbacteria bacterium]MBU2593358.1 hypothetical protein [Candidatus Edwardsbacteria bacterium]
MNHPARRLQLTFHDRRYFTYGSMGGSGGSGLVPVVVGGGGSSSATKFATPIAEISTTASKIELRNFFIITPKIIDFRLLVHILILSLSVPNKRFFSGSINYIALQRVMVYQKRLGFNNKKSQ